MLGVCYYPEHWPEDWWSKDARRMKELGISFVRIGEFAWSRYEPQRGKFAWNWLDRAMDTLAEEGLKVVLGTPTATPPKWLMDEYPEIAPVDEQGRSKGFGSRRHYTFSSEVWWQESRRIVDVMAERYGKHEGLVGWQTDNEYGCHMTILSYGQQDLQAFRKWLRQKYQSTDQLNEAWGNAFWSMELNSFDEVSLPNLTVTETNPAARLDFWRFHSDQVAAYNKMQCDIIRKHSPGRWITHNFMGFFNEFDHWKVAEDLDLTSHDSYPIGFAEQFLHNEAEKLRWSETSHPDIAPFHHDLYRGQGRGRFWVMEQQPGPVNWAPWNPIPKRGMVRLWTWEALAHGAEVVSYFRWRQAVSAQEQMHAGLNLPGLHELSQGGKEARQVAEDLLALGSLPESETGKVAIVYDYESSWHTRIQPQGQDFRYYELVFRWYEAVRKLGLDIDFVAPGASLEGYALVLVPTLVHVNHAAEQALSRAKGTVLYGPRTGSKTRHHAIPAELPPGPVGKLTATRILEVSSMRPRLTKKVRGKVAGTAERWLEVLDTKATVVSRFENGDPAFVAQGNHHYLACWPDEKLLNGVMAFAAKQAMLTTVEVPDGMRLRRRGDLLFAFNYGERPKKMKVAGKIILGQATTPPQDVTIWRVKS
jgi:beta-galactosidase